MKPSITSRERIIPKKATPEFSAKREFFKWVLYCSIGALIALMIHFSGESKEPIAPVAHADEIEQAPDSVQEAAYCRSWDKGATKITNLKSNMLVAAHCAKYL
jgi:hypothetical protein